MSEQTPTPKVGKMRPSSAVSLHGPGSVVDLPDLSVIMMGLEYWQPNIDDVVSEPRLEQYLQVDKLIAPPKPGPGKFGGVPSSVFPEYLVCSHQNCRQIKHYEKFTGQYWFNSTRFICTNEQKHPGRRPPAYPSRFMVACEKGHIDDFPWSQWVHKDSACNGLLQLVDSGNSGTVADIRIKCTSCNASRSMADAFKKNAHTSCSGRKPWISAGAKETCDKVPRTLLRGASNAYFSAMASAITIPPWSDPLHSDVARYRDQLQQADSFEKLKQGIEFGFYKVPELLAKYTLEEIWKALTTKPEPEDLKVEEWRALTKPDGYSAIQAGHEFETSPQEIPSGFEGLIGQVMAVTRLREVRALRGFTRIDAAPDLGDEEVSGIDIRIAKLKDDPLINWLPAVDLRGEGIFIVLQEDGPQGLQAWESSELVVAEGERQAVLWKKWREERSLPEKVFPGMRFYLLHSLSHALVRQLALDSGYSSSSIRERLYVATGKTPMAGVLLYTASNDSDGSLGGLVDQAKPSRLRDVLVGALREAALCAQDPLCGGREMASFANLNGSACHSCLLIAETSCECGNRRLDRNLLVRTVGSTGLEFFNGF